MGSNKTAVSASSLGYRPELKYPSLEWFCCMPEHFKKPVFCWFIFMNSKSQHIKLILPLNQESDYLAIHLEEDFLVN